MRESLAMRLLDWHGGQWSPLYSVGSCMLSGILPKRAAVKAALRELKACHDHEGTTDKHKRELRGLAGELRRWYQGLTH